MTVECPSLPCWPCSGLCCPSSTLHRSHMLVSMGFHSQRASSALLVISKTVRISRGTLPFLVSDLDIPESNLSWIAQHSIMIGRDWDILASASQRRVMEPTSTALCNWMIWLTWLNSWNATEFLLKARLPTDGTCKSSNQLFIVKLSSTWFYPISKYFTKPTYYNAAWRATSTATLEVYYIVKG